MKTRHGAHDGKKQESIRCAPDLRAPRQQGGYEEPLNATAKKSGPAVEHKSGRDHRKDEEEEAVRAGVSPLGRGERHRQ